MSQENKRKIVKEARNFDDLAWNEKSVNYLMLPYMIMCVICIYAFFYLLYHDGDISKKISVIGYLSIVLPMMWFSSRNYLFSFFILEVVMLIIPAYNFAIDKTINWLGFLISAIIISQWFKTPIRIELYRRKHGLSKPQNIKKDIWVGAGLFVLFPLLWGLSLLLK